MIRQEELDALLAQSMMQECAVADDVPLQNEQRQDRRWRVFDQYANLYCRGVEYWVAIRDISRSGVRVVDAPDPVIVGTKVLIVMMFDQGTLAVGCDVVRVFESSGRRYAGLRFAPHYPEELEPLAAYLDALEQTTLSET
jgi:hypothetical protein